MPKLIARPTVIEAAGNKPKHIAEYVGRVNSATTAVSVAHMKSYSSPGTEGAEYVAVCLPAFSPSTVHRGS